MTAATAKQLNILPHISVPLTFRKRGLTLGASFLGGLFYSFSEKTSDDKPDETCTRTKVGICKELRLSTSTIWRGMNKLKNDGYVEEVENKHDTYVFDHTLTQYDLFIRVPKMLLTEEWEISYKARKNRPAYKVKRYLTFAEVAVAGWIITQCDNLKKDKKKFKTTNTELAETLGLSESTVQSALDTVISAKIIFTDKKGVNRYKKSVYHVHDRFIRKQKKQNKEQPSEQQQGGVVVHKTAEELKRERIEEAQEQYYNAKHLAEDIAERNYNRAMQDEDFRASENRLSSLSFELALAEARNLPTLAELCKEYERLQKRRKAALKRIGLKEQDLHPPGVENE